MKRRSTTAAEVHDRLCAALRNSDALEDLKQKVRLVLAELQEDLWLRPPPLCSEGCGNAAEVSAFCRACYP
jgi:hypothetical protein